ncbi:MAG: hypothetical protein HQM16_10145 [Deltaproteobacteria bacterium]|nr:hypothetical protein [Deltaproteobacteria bacterium]
MKKTERTIEIGFKNQQNKKPVTVKVANGERLALLVEVVDDEKIKVRPVDKKEDFFNIPDGIREKLRWIYSNTLWDVKNTAEFLGAVAGVGVKCAKNFDTVFLSKMHEVRDVLLSNKKDKTDQG